MKTTASCVVRFIAAPTVALLSLASASADLIALTGRPAPGTPAAFSLFGPAEFDGAPAIGGDSTFAFAGLLSDGTRGFWLDHGAGPELLALSGTHAPGTEPGVVFLQRSSEVVIFTPPLLVPGHTVLSNTLAGPGVGFDNDQGIWHSTGSGLALMVREGAPAPGLAGVRLSTMSLQSLDDAGRAILSVLLTGAVDLDSNESIWRVSPDGTLELLAREGSAAPRAGPGVVFAAPNVPFAFPIVTGNRAGDVLFQGNLRGPGTDPHNDEALFIRDASGTRVLIREGDPVPGMPGFAFREGPTAGFHFSDISLGRDGHVAITARIASSTQTAGALLCDTAGGLAVLVRSGDPAPGTNSGFDLLVSPNLNIRGDVAFLASTLPGSQFPSLGLWVRSAGGVRAVALPGQSVAGGTIDSIQSINGFNDGGLLLFTALLSAPGGGTALLSADPTGQISIVARTGAALAVGAGDLRTVSQIVTRQRALSDNGHAAFAVRFTDGSGAQFLATVAGACYPNCDGSTVAPALNVNDFTCFLNRFAAGDSYANCDGSTAAPVLNVNDFGCFLNRFSAGCS